MSETESHAMRGYGEMVSHQTLERLAGFVEQQS